MMSEPVRLCLECGKELSDHNETNFCYACHVADEKAEYEDALNAEDEVQLEDEDEDDSEWEDKDD